MEPEMFYKNEVEGAPGGSTRNLQLETQSVVSDYGRRDLEQQNQMKALDLSLEVSSHYSND
jgi:hypothetical protein